MRMKHAMEEMREKVKNNLNAFREELEDFDAIELRLTEHAENNQKSMEKMEEDQE